MLKPVDIVVLSKVLVTPDEHWNQPSLARELGLPVTNVHRALKQLEQSGLLTDRRPQRQAFFGLVTHAVRHVYPPVMGAPSRGVPTAHLIELVASPGYVWPQDDGRITGTALTPLHASVPFAALRDPQFHNLMSLIDAFRIGRARELTLATQHLRHALHL